MTQHTQRQDEHPEIPPVVVYVAGAYTAADRWTQEQHIRAAEQWALDLATLGVVPLCPHTMYRHFEGTLSGRFWYAATLALLRRCDALFLVPGWAASDGATREAAEAAWLGIPLCESLAEVQAVVRGISKGVTGGSSDYGAKGNDRRGRS